VSLGSLREEGFRMIDEMKVEGLNSLVGEMKEGSGVIEKNGVLKAVYPKLRISVTINKSYLDLGREGALKVVRLLDEAIVAYDRC